MVYIYTLVVHRENTSTSETTISAQKTIAAVVVVDGCKYDSRVSSVTRYVPCTVVAALRANGLCPCAAEKSDAYFVISHWFLGN